MKLLTATLLFLLCPAFAFANRTGSDLLSDCQKADKPSSEYAGLDFQNEAYCVAFITGVAEANDVWWESLGKAVPSGAANYCLPKGVSRGQSELIVLKYLRDHPERLHLPAAKLVIEALTQAFPCS